MDKKDVITISENDFRTQKVMEAKDNQLKAAFNEAAHLHAELMVTQAKLSSVLAENAQLKADAARASIKKTSPKLAGKIEDPHKDLLKKAGEDALAALANGKDATHAGD